jgi:hypothetical protein
VLDNHDGQLLPTLGVREQVIREIRQWKADIVIAPRPNDYHPAISNSEAMTYATQILDKRVVLSIRETWSSV